MTAKKPQPHLLTCGSGCMYRIHRDAKTSVPVRAVVHDSSKIVFGFPNMVNTVYHIFFVLSRPQNRNKT